MIRTAMVIGGGVAGPVVAMALQKAGIEAVVYEARPDRPGNAGSMLTLAPNGIDALRVLNFDGAALGFATPRIVLRNAAGRELGATSTGVALDDGTVGRTLKRADLYRAVHDAAVDRGIRVRHDKRLVSAVENGNSVQASFADGTTAAADVLIGADGVWSTVRRVIDPAAPKPKYAGLLTIGGFTRGVAAGSGTAGAGNYQMTFGRRGFFGWATDPDDEVWWFANVPRAAEPAPAELAGDWRGRLVGLFADDDGPAVELIRQASEVSTMSAIHTMGHLPRWHTDRLVVLGDAAHAPSPSSGQGASLSIEDAVVLAQCLRDNVDPAAAFTAFEAARRSRVERIVKWAARVNSSKAAGPIGARIRDAFMPTVLKLTADSKATRQVSDFHLNWR